jgi:hypothetical protein
MLILVHASRKVVDESNSQARSDPFYLFWGKPENKKITFIPSSEDPGFVRVVGGEEGYISS